MIAGEPRVVEREGERVLVDGNGDRLVCRLDQGRAEKRRIYHRVDLDAFAGGAVTPVCYTPSEDRTYLLRREADLTPLWRGCTRAACFGEHEWGYQGCSTLTTTLTEMSVEEFDQARGESDE
jgi:hypothetical protein